VDRNGPFFLAGTGIAANNDSRVVEGTQHGERVHPQQSSSLPGKK
jgi:hypothetical protein